MTEKRWEHVQEVTETMESAVGVVGHVHRNMHKPPSRDNAINSWRQYLADLEEEAAAVRTALEYHFTDQRIDMEIAATVENLQNDWPEAADYGHVEDHSDYTFEIFDKDDKVIGTISEDELLRHHLVALDESEVI